MPMANSVVPGSLAKCRASDSTAAAGAQVSSSTVLGSKCAAYSWTRSNTGRQRSFLPSASATSTEPSSSASATFEFRPTMSRVSSFGAFEARSHHT